MEGFPWALQPGTAQQRHGEPICEIFPTPHLLFGSLGKKKIERRRRKKRNSQLFLSWFVWWRSSPKEAIIIIVAFWLSVVTPCGRVDLKKPQPSSSVGHSLLLGISPWPRTTWTHLFSLGSWDPSAPEHGSSKMQRLRVLLALGHLPYCWHIHSVPFMSIPQMPWPYPWLLRTNLPCLLANAINLCPLALQTPAQLDAEVPTSGQGGDLCTTSCRTGGTRQRVCTANRDHGTQPWRWEQAENRSRE